MQVVYPEIIEEDVVHPKSHCGHGHTVTPDHPVFVCQYILLPDGLQTLHGGIEPVQGHKHKEYPFPEGSLCEEAHVEAGGCAQQQYHQHIDLPHPDMDLLSFLQDIGGELGKGCRDAEHTGKDVYVKTESVNGFEEKNGPFFNETETAAEGKIRKGIPYQE